MLVPPRPTKDDDPHFAVRVAAMAVVCVVAIQIMKPPLAPILASLPVGMIAALRMAFSPFRVVGGAIAIALLAILTAALAEGLRDMPLVMLIVTYLIYLVGFRISLTTGSPVGLVVLIVTALTMFMGMTSPMHAQMTRDSFLMAALTIGLAGPILYLLFPPATTQPMPEAYDPMPDAGRSAAIRAAVLLVLTLWLHATLYVADSIFAIAAVFILVLPSKREQWAEAADRSLATVIGGIAALTVLGLLLVVNQYPVFLLLIFLASLMLANRMMTTGLNATVYQFSLSVMLALVFIALTTQSPAYAAFTRLAVTLAGGMVAVMATTLLESVFLRPANRSGQAGALVNRR